MVDVSTKLKLKYNRNEIVQIFTISYIGNRNKITDPTTDFCLLRKIKLNWYIAKIFRL